MSNRHWEIGAGALVVLGLVAFVASFVHPSHRAQARRGDGGGMAPAFSLPDTQGKLHTLESLKGKPVLVNFWATWCAPCRAELPEIASLAKSHPQCLEVVGVSEGGDSPDALDAFAIENGLGYTLLVDDGAVGDLYQVKTIPYSFLISPDGKIAHTYRGAITEQQIRADLGAFSGSC